MSLGKDKNPKGGSKGASLKDKNTKGTVSLLARETAEIKKLEARIAEEMPAPGSTNVQASEFKDLPISKYSQTGLDRAKFRVMTQIQRIAIPHALAGRDILGAAKTGSGKTLAFIVPVLEKLYRSQWAAGDGLGALIISPTRELAIQIFEVLRSAGQCHFSLSAGLVTGGKDFSEEQAAISQMCILVGTPGRVLQHLEQTPGFDTTNLQTLVLDEADRLLDMGFSDTLNSILSYLPRAPARQTLLFSATQTKNVKDLARLSLNQPEYVSVHDKAESATPIKLSQHYMIVSLQDKMNVLYSFIRTHLKQKTIVFVSSCKEAKYIFEIFRRLRPGVPLQLLHGKMKQSRRMLVYYDFCQKPEGVLFATDIAARGLDFPDVDWVLQLDCPEDVATYIHRVGRTARFRNKGHSLSLFLPTEAPAMVSLLTAAKVPVSETKLSKNSAISVTGKLAAEVAADPELKMMAQRAFLSYMKSVFLQPNRDVFKYSELPATAFGESLGLAVVPELPFALNAASDANRLRDAAHKAKNANKGLARLKEKIKREKELRRQQKQSSDSDSESGSDSDSESSSDSSSDSDSRRKSKKSATHAKSRTDSSSEDDLLVAKHGRVVEPAEEYTLGSENPEEEADHSGIEWTAEELARLTPHERNRVLRIIRDTKALGTASSEVLTPFQRIALTKSKELAEKRSSAAQQPLNSGEEGEGDEEQRLQQAYARRVAARLAERDADDRERERRRVRQMHKDAKLLAKGIDPKEGEKPEKSGYNLEASEGEESDDDGVDQRYLHSSGSEDESSSSDGESVNEGGKRKRAKNEPIPETLDDMEAMALAMMSKKSKKF